MNTHDLQYTIQEGILKRHKNVQLFSPWLAGCQRF